MKLVRLNVADSVGHFEANGGVFHRTELLADVAVIFGFGNCPHDDYDLLMRERPLLHRPPPFLKRSLTFPLA